ncbi:hypothetical protein NH398_05735 [Halomonas sp. CnH100-B]|uniref:hypothetical protein n=1 Tax=Halomonas sp. CnH100-B TaxID=2954490 RepID=UPI002098172D|nr:hypothetical protein [Halomonas sp. CnH100-B]MCO7228732.1 hypothetical protein [Halomonas sp. CnH100-B]
MIKVLKCAVAFFFVFFACLALAESGESSSGGYAKDFFLAIIDVLKIPVSIVLTLWLVKGRLRLFIMKDLVAKRLNELDDIKKKVRKKALHALNEINDLGEIPPHVFIDESDLSFAEEMLSEIEDEAVHAERGLASVSVISSRFFSNFKTEYMRFNRRSEGSFKVKKLEFYYLLHSSVSYIELNAARSMEVPNEVSFSEKSEFGNKAWPLIKKSGVGGINGVDQGATITPYDYHFSHYFFSVFDFHILNNFYLANKVFFSMLKDCNISYFYFIFNGWYVPNEFFMDEKADFFNHRRHLKFIAVKPQISLSAINEADKDQLVLFYSNLDAHYVFLKNSNASEIRQCFEKAFGFPAEEVRVMRDLEVVSVTVKKRYAVALYKRNVFNISYNAYLNSEKGFFEFARSSIKKGSPLALYVFLMMLYKLLCSFLSFVFLVFKKYFLPCYFFVKGLVSIVFAKFFKILFKPLI